MTTCAVCSKRISLDPYGPGWVHTYPRWHIFAADGHYARLDATKGEE